MVVPLLMLVTEPSPDLLDIVSQAIAGGVDAVQFRDHRLLNTDIKASVGELRSVTGDALLLVNRRPDAVGQSADGVHLSERGISVLQAREILHGLIIGRSIHTIEAAIRARDEGADYVVAGTIFPSLSHPGEPGQGTDFLRAVCAAVAPLPVVAIGGITPERVGECIAAGAAGVAVLSPIMRASDARAVAARYRQELDGAWNLRSTENR